MKRLCPILLLLSLSACKYELTKAPVPNLSWTAFDAATAKSLQAADRPALEGIYTTGEAADDFGKEAALKWSWAVTGNDTTYYLSFFCSEDVRYFICQGKRNDTAVLLNGYWRNVHNTKTGKAWFTVPLSQLYSGGDAAGSEQRLSLLISGHYGLGEEDPQKPITFRYNRPLHTETPYHLVAHRGGGVNNDLLPASENSLEMILMAAQLGGTGLEIDVQVTKDGVPVLYHDGKLNDRLTKDTEIDGAIADYNLAQLKSKVTLNRGGRIPTLEEALDCILQRTPLNFVWIDCKFPQAVPKAHELQKAFLAKADAAGRKMEIVLGIPDEDVLAAFTKLPDYKNIPSLCELDTAKTAGINANYWGPSWMKGKHAEELAGMQARGKKGLIWTVDIPQQVKDVIYNTRFNGLCSNRPQMAAYYYYAKQ